MVVADITVDYHGVRFEFRTRNPKRRPTWMAIHLERGPFRHFDGEWKLTPLAADGCRIDFAAALRFRAARRLASSRAPVFDRIANTLVDAFVARADQVDARPTRRRATARDAAGAAPPAQARRRRPP